MEKILKYYFVLSLLDFILVFSNLDCSLTNNKLVRTMRCTIYLYLIIYFF